MCVNYGGSNGREKDWAAAPLVRVSVIGAVV